MFPARRGAVVRLVPSEEVQIRYQPVAVAKIAMTVS
jgi:hypothetical protein